MGQAKNRGTFEERKAEAIKAGRIPVVRRLEQARARAQARYDRMEVLRAYEIALALRSSG